MNRGWKRGFNPVASARAAENFNSPTSPFNMRSSPVTLTMNSWDLVKMTANNVLCTLPANPAIGDQAGCYYGSGATFGGQLRANTGQTINNGAFILPGSTSQSFGIAIAEYVGFGSWVVTNVVGSDAGAGLNVSGTFTVTGHAASLQAGINTAGHASFTSGTITSGSAVTPNGSFDTFVNVNVVATTAGTVAITYGPSTGAENTWCPSTNLLVGMGENIGLPVPNGWKFVVTLTGTTVTATYSVHLY